jgi:hypothetical protein|uniref:Uncharacterized protein n=1 Tax=Siphoviridae sp. ctHip2 TaxID=2827830 RepID=A0A8S5RVA8_9CAUD|nr:MAG TPA: hypothetical protein [Siphoviridae sp. ctHip2]
MPLPKRKLPSLDNDFSSVNTHEEFEEIQELTDDDFINDNSDFEQVEPNESSSYVQDEIEEVPEPEEIEEVKSTPKKEKKGRIKPKKKKFNFSFDYKKLTKKHYFIISGVFVAFLIAFVAISLLMKPKENTDNSTETTPKVEQTESKTDVKYTFKKETSNGIIFEVTSEHSTKINLQRAFYDSKGNIVVCESGDIEIIKGKQDVFAECVNNKESTDIKDTDKNLIKDNLIEIKE